MLTAHRDDVIVTTVIIVCTYISWGLYVYISYGDCATIGNYVLQQSPISGIDLQVKNGIRSKMFGRLTQKVRLLRTHHTYNISHIVR